MKSRKIALIGTHGTGKTTIAHDLITKLKKLGCDADFLGEVARRCPFEINENSTKKSQLWMFFQQLIWEIEAEERNDLLICDRSLLDYYAYYVNLFGRAEFLEPLIKKHLQTYDLLIKIPIRKGFLQKDRIRSVNEDFQKNIDVLIDKILKRFKVRYIQFKEENLSNTEIVERILREIKCQKNNSNEI